MKGLQEALRDREERHLRVERHDISEEQEEHNQISILEAENCLWTSAFPPGQMLPFSLYFLWFRTFWAYSGK